MILQALTSYYDRLLAQPESKVPQPGFSKQAVHFCLVLTKNGKLAGDPIDLRKNGKPRSIVVPQAVKRSSGVAANFCWDNTTYVLGADDKGKPSQAEVRHTAFVSLFASIVEGMEDDGATALLAFFANWSPENAQSLPLWEEMAGANIVFRLAGDFRFLHERQAIQAAWIQHIAKDNGGEEGFCLVSGNREVISKIHPAIKGVPGTQTSGAALISFNLPAFTSFGKDQNLNAPVGKTATFAYTTALNYLLDRSNRRKIQIGDATTVFWAESATPAEDDLFQMLDPGSIQNEDMEESERVDTEERIHTHLTALSSGQLPEKWTETDCRFYLLGLSPNAARISVRFFHDATLGELARTIGLHYRQLAIVNQFDRDPAFPSPRRILKSLAIREDAKLLSPILSGQLMQAILTGRPYPRSLFSAVMGRIRAERKADRIRAGLVKAILIRNHKMEISEMLDPENRQIGYVLGRLFSVLEKLQDEAIPGTNATIRDRFFNSASATPQRAFHVLLKNAQNHLAKLRKDPEKKGLAITRDRLITDLVNRITAYPVSLPIEEQGLFTLGYYHQKKDLFTKKTEK